MSHRAPATTPRTLLTIDWDALCDKHKVSKCCYDWVSDESITKVLETVPFRPIDLPYPKNTHRAKRIANIIILMRSGVTFDPLIVDVTRFRVHLKDGHHRLRAYKYLGKLNAVPISVTGQLDKIIHACSTQVIHSKEDTCPDLSNSYVIPPPIPKKEST